MANRLAVMRRSLTNFILLSAPWKTTWRGPTKLPIFSCVFCFAVFISLLARIEMVDTQLRQTEKSTNTSTTLSTNNQTLNNKSSSLVDIPGNEKNLCSHHDTISAIACWSENLAVVGLCSYLLAVIWLLGLRGVQYDLTGGLMFPNAVRARLRLCRLTITVSGAWYFCFIVSTFILIYECDAIGWPIMTCQIFLDNPVIGGFVYLVLWWFATTGPQRLK